jgi:hypothetical protein
MTRPNVYVLYGVTHRDREENVCMFFPNMDDTDQFRQYLPGNYKVMVLSGVDYDALTVMGHTSV